ncbi:surface protease GP63, partial [Trypanosoma cruzi]
MHHPLTDSVVPHRWYYCSRRDSAYFTHLIVPQYIRSCGRRIQTAVPNTVSGSPHPYMSQRSGVGLSARRQTTRESCAGSTTHGAAVNDSGGDASICRK